MGGRGKNPESGQQTQTARCLRRGPARSFPYPVVPGCGILRTGSRLAGHILWIDSGIC